MKRKVCVITGSRAEYGLLSPLMREISGDKKLILQLIVTGMHLSHHFGSTYREIEKDGFLIDEKINMRLTSDTPAGVVKSMSIAMLKISRAYQRLKPDLIVVLGDRVEILSAVIAALVNNIPVAHIGGGEVTEGVFDEAIRHSLTKMSHLHFPTTEEHRKRILQLGENPKNVFNVGSPGVANIRMMRLLPKEELERELGITFCRHNLLVTFHPVTLEKEYGKRQFEKLLKVLDRLKNTFIIFTKANADTGGRIINRMVDEYVSLHHAESISFASLGQLKYLSTMQFVDAVVGNSSSGIIEAPSFKIGTINIGDRQKGRARSSSIIDCLPTEKSIERAFKILYSKEFRRKLRKVKNIYSADATFLKIKEIIKKAELRNILKKKFYDVTSQIR